MTLTERLLFIATLLLAQLRAKAVTTQQPVSPVAATATANPKPVPAPMVQLGQTIVGVVIGVVIALVVVAIVIKFLCGRSRKEPGLAGSRQALLPAPSSPYQLAASIKLVAFFDLDYTLFAFRKKPVQINCRATNIVYAKNNYAQPELFDKTAYVRCLGGVPFYAINPERMGRVIQAMIDQGWQICFVTSGIYTREMPRRILAEMFQVELPEGFSFFNRYAAKTKDNHLDKAKIIKAFMEANPQIEAHFMDDDSRQIISVMGALSHKDQQRMHYHHVQYTISDSYVRELERALDIDPSIEVRVASAALS